MNQQYRQVTAKRSINGSNFDKGIIDFDFSIGGKTVVIPSKSYFRVGLKLTQNDGLTPPVIANDVGFSNDPVACMFDNCSMLAGGQMISNCVNYLPQAHIVSTRLGKSGSWLNSLGKDAYGFDSNFDNRARKVTSDALNDDVDIYSTPRLEDVDQSITYFMFQPPLGIMSSDKPLRSGDYRFSFNPNSNYKKACVESSTSLEPGTGYDLFVESMELYICTERMEIDATGVDTLYLIEQQVQSKQLTGDETNLDFTIPPSTKALSIFLQDPVANSNTIIPPTKLRTIGEFQNKLKSIQLSYANVTKPPTRWTSDFKSGTNQLQQRYLDTQIESGMAFSSGGCETLQQWKDGGLLLHYGWLRDASDRSTQLQIQANWEGASGKNLFVVAHYSKTAQISVTNGFVSEVITLAV